MDLYPSDSTPGRVSCALENPFRTYLRTGPARARIISGLHRVCPSNSVADPPISRHISLGKPSPARFNQPFETKWAIGVKHNLARATTGRSTTGFAGQRRER